MTTTTTTLPDLARELRQHLAMVPSLHDYEGLDAAEAFRREAERQTRQAETMSTFARRQIEATNVTRAREFEQSAERLRMLARAATLAAGGMTPDEAVAETLAGWQQTVRTLEDRGYVVPEPPIDITQRVVRLEVDHHRMFIGGVRSAWAKDTVQPAGDITVSGSVLAIPRGRVNRPFKLGGHLFVSVGGVALRVVPAAEYRGQTFTYDEKRKADPDTKLYDPYNRTTPEAKLDFLEGVRVTYKERRFVMTGPCLVFISHHYGHCTEKGHDLYVQLTAAQRRQTQPGGEPAPPDTPATPPPPAQATTPGEERVYVPASRLWHDSPDADIPRHLTVAELAGGEILGTFSHDGQLFAAVGTALGPGRRPYAYVRAFRLVSPDAYRGETHTYGQHNPLRWREGVRYEGLKVRLRGTDDYFVMTGPQVRFMPEPAEPAAGPEEPPTKEVIALILSAAAPEDLRDLTRQLGLQNLSRFPEDARTRVELALLARHLELRHQEPDASVPDPLQNPILVPPERLRYWDGAGGDRDLPALLAAELRARGGTWHGDIISGIDVPFTAERFTTERFFVHEGRLFVGVGARWEKTSHPTCHEIQARELVALDRYSGVVYFPDEWTAFTDAERADRGNGCVVLVCGAPCVLLGTPYVFRNENLSEGDEAEPTGETEERPAGPAGAVEPGEAERQYDDGRGPALREAALQNFGEPYYVHREGGAVRREEFGVYLGERNTVPVFFYYPESRTWSTNYRIPGAGEEFNTSLRYHFNLTLRRIPNTSPHKQKVRNFLATLRSVASWIPPSRFSDADSARPKGAFVHGTRSRAEADQVGDMTAAVIDVHVEDARIVPGGDIFQTLSTVEGYLNAGRIKRPFHFAGEHQFVAVAEQEEGGRPVVYAMRVVAPTEYTGATETHLQRLPRRGERPAGPTSLEGMVVNHGTRPYVLTSPALRIRRQSDAPPAPAPPERPAFRIKWTSSYRLEADYEITPRVGEHGTLSLRYAAEEYDPSRWNYTREEHEREVAGALGILRWSHGSHEPVPLEVFRSFVEQFGGNYPDITLHRGYYTPGRGWVRVDDEGRDITTTADTRAARETA